ncbi:hypothetical protein MUN82_02285 [Hymenobacter aerilatus]|uniref:Uncharacterized protein n=1 Tax=Hymenobacter aerilatus TaxID=2932251 RepID=A0A8T9T0D3_9BACT|nr:hypothetical protein [Hymenobacter aerilatus]UOR05940.1 hypothetical protein MUN82_02285 [Hymenobacter aerilatus]
MKFIILLFGLHSCDNQKIKHEPLRIVDNKIFSDTQTIDGYTKKAVFIETIDRGDYFYIPKSSFLDTVDAVIFQDKNFEKVSPDKRSIKLFWNTICNDGSYIITITPEQIFLSSGHNNPNPNGLYWVLEIDKSQFQAINSGIRKNPPANFYNLSIPRNDSLFQAQNVYQYLENKDYDSCLIPSDWNEQTEKVFNTCCNKMFDRQLIAYSAILNSYIPKNINRIKFPDRNSYKVKTFGMSKNMIFDWMSTVYIKKEN